jgi:hypothetical protein
MDSENTFRQYAQYAEDCMRRADDEEAPEGRNILLNMALAWVRLAHQTQDLLADLPDDLPAAASVSEAAAEAVTA